MRAFDRGLHVLHPAWLIMVLSLTPAVGLGVGRFAHTLVLPDMRNTLGWSYSAAGFMNTTNAVGYLGGALAASKLIKYYALVAAAAFIRFNYPPAMWPAAIAGMTISFGLGQTLGPFAMGAISDTTGRLSDALSVSAATLAVGAILALLQRKLKNGH